MGGAGAVLEAYKRRLERSLGRLGAVLGALEAMLEPSGGQKAPKMEPKSSPNRAPKATLAEDAETLIFNESCKDFNDFQVSGHYFCVKYMFKMGSESHHRLGTRQKAS